MKPWIITLALLSLCGWLGRTAYEQAVKPVPSTSPSARNVLAVNTQDKKISGRERKAIDFAPLETLDDIVSRPLFNVSRRPIEAENTAQDAKPSELNVMLSGIVIGHTSQIAHLRAATDKETQALRIGDKIGGWLIQSIFADRVVLKSGSRVETLYMQKPGESNAASRAKPQTRRARKKVERNARRNLRQIRRRGEQ